MKTIEKLAQEYCENPDNVERSEFNAFIAGYLSAQMWINILREEPPSSKYILCLTKGNRPFVGEYDGKDSILAGHSIIEYDELTYWKPISLAINSKMIIEKRYRIIAKESTHCLHKNYWVQMLVNGFFRDKWKNIKKFKTIEEAQELLNILQVNK